MSGARHHMPMALPALAMLLAALAMVGPFTIDTYLPAFPYIARELQATPAQMQQTLSVYLFTLAVMTLFHGTVSDAVGRRPVILGSLLVYLVSAVGCAVASDFSHLLAWRAVQGLAAGSGIIVGRAIIRDSLEGPPAQRLMSVVTMIFGIAPAIAPVIGGWLQASSGWRAIFWFLVAYSGVLWMVVAYRLPETHPAANRIPFRARVLFANYGRLARDRRLLMLCTVIAFNFSGFFLYVVSAPAVIYQLLGLTERDFAWLFVPGISGVMGGAFLSGRLADRLTPERTVFVGYCVMGTAATLNVFYCSVWPPALPWTVLPVMLYTIGMSMTMPSVSLLALDRFPQLRGMTSSYQGFAHSFLAGVTAGVISPWVSGSALGLACTMATFAALAGALWWAYRHLESVAAIKNN
jgi:DHA1 family bicyclomycin/chloramphenicol resistance-like MFS transporter